MGFREDFDQAWSDLDIASFMGDSISHTPGQYPHPSVNTTSLWALITRRYIETTQTQGVRTLAIVSDKDLQAKYMDYIEHDNVVYRVKELQPDGSGMTTLVLEQEVYGPT